MSAETKNKVGKKLFDLVDQKKFDEAMEYFNTLSASEKVSHLEYRGSFGRTTLTWAAFHNAPEALTKALVDNGPQGLIDIPRSGGWTPLTIAAGYGHVKVMDNLLTLGADASIVTDDGKTAFDWADNQKNKEALAVLKKHGIDGIGKLEAGYRSPLSKGDVIDRSRTLPFDLLS
jgi:ankyrin repeat protein